MRVAELGEHGLLARILQRLPPAGESVLTGPGDDAAVIAPSRNTRLVVTTDAMVEGVHFSRAYSTPEEIGHRALAVNLSDLAAMGATPRWATLSLVLPAALRVEDVDRLVEGLAALARRYGVSVAGGNITRTDGPLVLDVTAGGEVGPRKWLTRSGARPGDALFVSGTVGAARAGLEMLKAGAQGDCARYKAPEPRVRLGVALGRARAVHAAIDLSDGLADGLHRMADASGVGVRVDADLLPIEPAARTWWSDRGVDAVSAAVAGGDDYELLIAVPAKGAAALRAATRHAATPPLTRIGAVTKDPHERVIVRGEKEEEIPRGYEHFVAERTADCQLPTVE